MLISNRGCHSSLPSISSYIKTFHYVFFAIFLKIDALPFSPQNDGGRAWDEFIADLGFVIEGQQFNVKLFPASSHPVSTKWFFQALIVQNFVLHEYIAFLKGKPEKYSSRIFCIRYISLFNHLLAIAITNSFRGG